MVLKFTAKRAHFTVVLLHPDSVDQVRTRMTCAYLCCNTHTAVRARMQYVRTVPGTLSDTLDLGDRLSTSSLSLDGECDHTLSL